MRDQALTKREEARLIKAYQRILQEGGFPNPDRAGCPDNKTLRAIAFRKIGIEQVKDWSEHLATCTPCFHEYTEFRKQVEWRREAAYLSMAAAVILVVFAVGWWKLRASHPVVITAHNQVVADMRNRLTLRGGRGREPSEGPLVLGRGIDDVSFYLPEGSRAGTYEVAVFREELGEPLASATGLASVEKSTTRMKATLDLSRIPSGHYLLGIRLPGVEWSYYPLMIR
jgi:hypothetical protein